MTRSETGERGLRCAELVRDADLPSITDAALVIGAGGGLLDAGAWDEVRSKWPRVTFEDHRPLVAIPGLIDAHSHARGLPLDGILEAPLERFILRLAAATPVPAADDALVAAVALLETGVTTVQPIFHTTAPEPVYSREARAVGEALRVGGIRFELVLGFADVPGALPAGTDLAHVPDAEARGMLRPPSPALGAADYLAAFDALVTEAVGAPDETRPRVTLGPVAPQWAAAAVWEGIRERCVAGARVHAHLLETARQRPPWLAEHPRRKLAVLGLPAGRTSLAHAVWLEQDDVDWLAREDVTVVHNPASNRRLASGDAPVRELLDAGVTVALGLDSNAAEEPPDVFADLRLARDVAAERGAPLDAAELLRMATTGGAAAVGRAGELGMLRPGARADLVLLDPAWRAGAADVVEALVEGASREHVRTVLVGGREVVGAGRGVAGPAAAAARTRLAALLAEDRDARAARLAVLERVEPWALAQWDVAGAEAAA